MMRALRLAGRQFAQQPTFAIVVTLVLGLGIAAATTVFTVVDAVVLRPLPYRAPDRLVTLWDTNAEKGLAHDPISPVNFMDYRALPVFSDAAVWWRPGVNLLDPGLDPVRVNTIEVSNNLFRVLGVSPQLGAGFPAGEELFVRGELAAVISDRLWRTRYGADPAVIGRPLSLNGEAWVVAGVMPPGFHYPDDVDVWQRLRWDLRQHSRAAHFMEAVARLSDGTGLEEAQSAVTTLGLRLESDFAATNKGWNARLVPLLEEQLGYYRPALMVMIGAVALLLVIGVLNVASLLLTRALSREREVAVRVAMGATPRQIVSQLLAESFVLSLGGALVGVVAAAVSLPLLLAFTPVEIPRLDEARVNLRALGLAIGVVAVTTFVFGLLPSMLLVKRQLSADLKSGERGSSRGARRVYSLLVAGEMALACMLLVAAGLLIRSVSELTTLPTGVDADTVVTTTVQLSDHPWKEVAPIHAAILEQVRQQPGVQQVGGTNFLPLENGWRGGFGIEGQPPPARPEDAPQTQMHSISEGYFETMGAPIAAGRAFTPFDGAASQPVLIVNETFARRFLSDGPAVGRVITTTATGIGPLGLNLMRPGPQKGVPHPPPTRFEVVGVVRDINNLPLGQATEPAIYFSTRQFPFREQFVVIRAADYDTAVAAMRAALNQVAPTVPMAPATTWGSRMADKTAEPRLLMSILIFFGGLAALLAALGVYGLFSWSVALRTRELAIRLTLGARPATVAALVLSQGALLIGGGLVVGLVLIRLAEGALDRVVFGVEPGDPLAAAAAGGLLAAAALLACLPAALGAMRVDPVVGLRAE